MRQRKQTQQEAQQEAWQWTPPQQVATMSMLIALRAESLLRPFLEMRNHGDGRNHLHLVTLLAMECYGVVMACP